MVPHHIAKVIRVDFKIERPTAFKQKYWGKNDQFSPDQGF